jgi:hypothetical protein
MSTPTSRKTYTRRNTRTRLIDLLKEAIELVEKGCPPGHMTRGPTSVLPTLPSAMSAMPATAMPAMLATEMPAMPATAMPPMPATAMPATATATATVTANATKTLKVKKTKVPLSAIPEENLRTQANSLASQVQVKPKRAPRPGVLKYNEFVKNWISKHPDYQAKGMYQAALKEIQRSGNWDRVSGTRKKVKTAAVTNATPARLSPTLPLRNNANTSNTTNANANTTAANATNATPATLDTPDMPYTNEGVNDAVGMNKITMNGRSLYLSSDNALFERDGNVLGDFIGRLVDGKIVEEEAPELPEYS